VAIRAGGAAWAAGLPSAPLGPLTAALPRYGHGATYPYVLAAAIGVALAAVLARSELRRSRRVAAE
jgi:hypothetical protein